jgi:hypothetical protein
MADIYIGQVLNAVNFIFVEKPRRATVFYVFGCAFDSVGVEFRSEAAKHRDDIVLVYLKLFDGFCDKVCR